MRYGEALVAVEEASDELDRAEALEVSASVRESARDAIGTYFSQDFLGELTRPRELLVEWDRYLLATKQTGVGASPIV